MNNMVTPVSVSMVVSWLDCRLLAPPHPHSMSDFKTYGRMRVFFGSRLLAYIPFDSISYLNQQVRILIWTFDLAQIVIVFAMHFRCWPTGNGMNGSVEQLIGPGLWIADILTFLAFPVLDPSGCTVDFIDYYYCYYYDGSRAYLHLVPLTQHHNHSSMSCPIFSYWSGTLSRPWTDAAHYSD